MPENQSAWNSENQGVKENINQNTQTGKAVDLADQLRKTVVRWQTRQVGRLAAVRWRAVWGGRRLTEVKTET